jgi:nucleoside recognition membrane protein YjiH
MKTFIHKLSDFAMRALSVTFFLSGLFCIGIVGAVVIDIFREFAFIKAHWEGALGIGATAGIMAILFLGFSSELWSTVLGDAEHQLTCPCGHNKS